MTGTVQCGSWARRVLSSARGLGVVLLLSVVVTARAQAQTYSVLYSFMGGADGANPYAGLVRDPSGNLYGTTEGGGSGGGVVFEVDTTGKETVLYSFNGADGANPYAGLVRDSSGNLYGTTGGGGWREHGVVFEVDTTGKETVLHTFRPGRSKDGSYPTGGLVRDAKGNLYGATSAGGATGNGTVFKLDKTGKETVLYSFCPMKNCADGASPNGDLVRDPSGNLYGTTTTGGYYSYGVVFKVSETGKETVLYTFTGGADGGEPAAGLVRDAAGNLYGTTPESSPGAGVVFKVSETGKETVLYTFTGGADGSIPRARLVRDSAGNLYGTTFYGGSHYGVVFKLDTTGKETVLYTFTGGADGRNPEAGLVRDAAGSLYGTTVLGGFSYGYGVVFELTP